ncbi:TonB-dependent receptor [uncultured Lutibacter sp.]|uniref:TonB-dependent receptor n=1 Tax=uncultured Lutibacter sp. TaxID=437739 RepID=UPI00260D2EB0|nr:TonB-dependent receptor [uncultured Lutibacter sp.]
MKIYLSYLFIGMAFVAQAQNKISGVIKTTQNEPLLGVQIYIEDLQKGTSTDENGYYELKNLPNIPIKITAVYIGFETQSKTVTFDKSEMILNFTLEEAVFKMEEIIIATPFNKLQSENVMKVEKASIQQLQHKGAATLMDGLNTIAGVSQVSTGVGIGKPIIRGLRGNRVLVYSQGIRLENQQFGDEHGLGIDESSIESVEVIKGPASLLYGSDALGGVVYFNPLKFADANSFDFTYNQSYHSNTQGTNTTFGAKQSYDSWKFLANSSRNSHSDYKTPNNTRITNTRFNETIFNSAIGFNSNFISSTLRFNYNSTKVGIPEEIGIQNNHKTPLLPYQDLTTKMLSWSNNFFLSNSKITSTFGYTLNERKEFEEHHHEEEATHEDEEHDEPLHPSLFLKLHTYSYDVKWHLPKLNKFETILGFQGLHQKNDNFGEEILIPNATLNDFGSFFTAFYNWKEHSIQGGIRFDTRSLKTEKHIVLHEDEEHIFDPIDKTFENFTASLGYKTKLFNKIISRINFATGFRAPNLAELTSNGVHHGSNRFEIGNNDLNSERNFQSDISFEYDSQHFEIFANGFYNRINNYIFISPTGNFEEEFAIYQYIQDDAKLYGGEFGAHLHPHPIDWLHLHSSFEFVIGKQDNKAYLPLIPAHKLTNTLRAEYDINKWLKNGFTSISLESTFKQDKISEFETTSNGYNLVNVGMGGKIKLSKISLDLSLNVNNLFNTSYISHLSRLKVNEFNNIGRNFIARIQFNI